MQFGAGGGTGVHVPETMKPHVLMASSAQHAIGVILEMLGLAGGAVHVAVPHATPLAPDEPPLPLPPLVPPVDVAMPPPLPLLPVTPPPPLPAPPPAVPPPLPATVLEPPLPATLAAPPLPFVFESESSSSPPPHAPVRAAAQINVNHSTLDRIS
jgi:hypothetical protein